MSTRSKVPPRKKVIPFQQTLFWDANPKVLDPKKNARYIIERILDFGNTKEARWIFSYYPKKLIREVIENSRSLHDKSRFLWSLVIR